MGLPRTLSLVLLMVLALACGGGGEPAPSCTDEQGCEGGLACVSGQCAPCKTHGACASDVCDVYADTPLGRGQCIPESRVFYVNGRGQYGGNCDEAGRTGAKDNPFCSIRGAVSAAGGDRSVIRVYPSVYFPFGVAGKQVRIYGPAGEGGIAQVYEEDYLGSRVSAGADVVLDGLEMGGPVVSGVRCTGDGGRSSLTVRRGAVLSDIGDALPATDCDLRLDRVLVTGGRRGLHLTRTRYAITTTVVSGSGDTGVRLVDSEGEFLFNTLIGNGSLSDAPGGIDCGATPVHLEDSILFGNAPNAAGSQLSGACALTRVVIGSLDTATDPGAIHEDPELDGYRLRSTAANQSCCIDKAPNRASVWADIDGNPRPRGPLSDLGASESP